MYEDEWDGDAEDADADVFWIAKQLHRVISRHSKEVMAQLVQMFHRRLATGSSTNVLYRQGRPALPHSTACTILSSLFPTAVTWRRSD